MMARLQALESEVRACDKRAESIAADSAVLVEELRCRDDLALLQLSALRACTLQRAFLSNLRARRTFAEAIDEYSRSTGGPR